MLGSAWAKVGSGSFSRSPGRGGAVGCKAPPGGVEDPPRCARRRQEGASTGLVDKASPEPDGRRGSEDNWPEVVEMVQSGPCWRKGRQP